MLITLCGLPGTGKTTIARHLARRLGAVHVRVDSIEQALLHSGFPAPPGPEGYVIAYAVASDNLRLGHGVVADCVNAAPVSRDAWAHVAKECGAGFLLVWLVCGDEGEHRRRVQDRRADIDGHVLPRWERVASMRFHAPAPDTLKIDTCACGPEEAAERILQRVNLSTGARQP